MRPRLSAWMLAALSAIAAHGAAADGTAARGNWHEEPLESPGPQGPLRGTLLSTDNAAAARDVVLIVPGSGPTDRDGNNPHGVYAAPYRLLAEGLAERGIDSVRIDKRGMFGSASAVPDANDVKMQDYARDVIGWIATVRQRTASACVWVAGHSEGGVVTLLANQPDIGLCGIILMATPGRPLGQLLRDQLRANPANAPLLPQAFSAIDSLEASRPVDAGALHPALQPLFAPEVQGFLIDSFAFDPARLATTAPPATLIVQGVRDLQVAIADAQRLHAAAPHATLAVLPTMNHVLKPVASDDREANMLTYAQPGLELAPGLVDAIARFIGTARTR